MSSDPQRGSRKVLPTPVATAVLLFKASDTTPLAFYPPRFEGDYVARELHSFVFPGNLADPTSSSKTTVAARQWEFHTFVLSGADNYRTYGHCLRFSYDTSKARSSTSKLNGHLDHALVVLSSFPFFDAIRTWLVPVVKDMVSPNPEKRMSIEPRISSLIHDVVAIRSNYIASQFVLQSPSPNDPSPPIICDFALPGDTSVILPLNFSMKTFLASINPNILVSIFELLLYAGHILFVSSRVSLLTIAAQSCISLIWPLSWDFAIYIPVLPNQIGVDAMNFPNAALVGILRSHPELPDRLEDVLQYNDALLIVDLDENRMIVGENCRASRLPPNIREKLIERLKLILSPDLVLCDIVDPDLGENTPMEDQLTTFGSPTLQVSQEEQVRIAFLLLLRDLCDGSSFEQKPLDEFKAAFLASPIYSLYQRNAHENSILKKLIRMTEDKATAYLLRKLSDIKASISTSVPPFHQPQHYWKSTEAPLVQNEIGFSTTGLTMFKSSFAAPLQRANELFQLAEQSYKKAVDSGAPQAVLSDWILIQLTFLLRAKRHHDCIRLLGQLENEHPIFICNDIMTLLMESLSSSELEAMAARQSGDKLGDAARAFREARYRQQPTTLSPESKELHNFIMTHDDTNEQKFLELVTNRNANVNASMGNASLLSTAVAMLKLRMAACLLRHGASPESDTTKNSIPHSLCSTKPRDEISYLLNVRVLCLALATGVNINRGDMYQNSPLSLLCTRPVPFIPLMKLLLANGADPNAVNVDEHPPAHFVVKTRMQQLLDTSPLALLLDMGANPLITVPSAQSFRALITAASDAVTNNLQPIHTYAENNKYLSSRYAILRGLRSSVTANAPLSTKDPAGGKPVNTSPGSLRQKATPGSPAIPNLNIAATAANASTTTSTDGAPSSPRSAAPPQPGALVAAKAAMAATGSSPSLPKPRSYGTLGGASDTPSTPSAAGSGGAAGASSATLEKSTLQKIAEAQEALALCNYAIVEAQFRIVLILNSIVHRYIADIAKRKRKGIFNKKRSSPHDMVLALSAPLQNLLLHHTTLSVDIRHHTTIYGSKPSIAACFASKITLLSDAQMEVASAFYANDGRSHLDALNAEDMSSIINQESDSIASLCGSWTPSDSSLVSMLIEVLDFPVKLAVLFEELAKRSATLQTGDGGKIQVLLGQLSHLRNRQDRLKHEAMMVQVLEEVGTKLTGIAQFSFMMAPGTTLLKTGNLKQVRNIDSTGLTKVPNNECLQSKAYLFSTSDENDNKGYLLLSSESISERKRIPLKKALIFDIPSYSANYTLHTALPAVAPVECTLLHTIAVIALHPSSTPHEFYLLECPNHESKISWLSALWRLCLEGRNWTHKRHFYEYIDRNPLSSEFEGWLDYSIDNEHTAPVVYTHYFSLRGTRLSATINPSEPTPIVIIFLDEYTIQNSEDVPGRTGFYLEPTKHLAPRYLLHFGPIPRILSKFPAYSQHSDWRSVLKHSFGAKEVRN